MDKADCDIYNSRNKKLSCRTILSFLGRYGLSRVNNLATYQLAFIHSSYTLAEWDIKRGSPTPRGEIPLCQSSNERLEFLGDGVLELVTKNYLYERFPEEDEGFMTEKKIALVKNDHIGKLAVILGLPKWYIMSTSTEEKGARNNIKKLGCLFEALIGAIFIDNGAGGTGYKVAEKVIRNIYERNVDWQRLVTTDDNYKNMLQVRIQKVFKTTPDYVELSHTRDDGYEMGVYLSLGRPIYLWDVSEAVPFTRYGSLENISKSVKPGSEVLICLGQGQSRAKKKAEQDACQVALQRIGFNSRK